MADNTLSGQAWIFGKQHPANTGEALILTLSIIVLNRAFQFDADGKIVTAFPAIIFGNSGMPGAAVKRHILPQVALAADQQMRGNPQLIDVFEIRMLVRIQAIAK